MSGMPEDPCPLCGSHSAIEQSEQIDVTDYGLLTLCYPVCEECGAELRPNDADLFMIELGHVPTA